jgi:UDP-N-acetylmuramoyl-L-alanyl-D-glutamate--2,6-diaminopimelate ligase
LQLADIIRRMPDLVALPASLAADWQDAAAEAIEVTGITADSRQVRHGMIFVAVPGRQQDGRRFIADAIARGAAVVLAPAGTRRVDGVRPYVFIEDPEPRQRMARIAALMAGAQPLVIAAVTGTNGKTSTVDFLRQFWAMAGHRAASLGTLGVVAPAIGRLPATGGLTTADPVTLAETMAALARGGVNRAAIEASSHGLDQFRLDGLRLTAGAFTNLTRDHLDYHGSLEAYREAKMRLFQRMLPGRAPTVASTALDADSMATLRRIAHRRRLALRVVGAGGEAIDLRRATPLADGQALELMVDGTRQEVHLKLPGRFQADNALVAAALAQVTGAPDALAHLGELAGVRGRMELVTRLANGATVYVDFAHTPDALATVLAALRPHTAGRLHIVFGAGGDRDRGKRVLMGRAAAAGADVVVVTDDNPRGEAPAEIRAAVMAGCPEAREIGGRALAIEVALGGLGPGDVLVVAGKGHEQGQVIGTETHPFDDAAVVRALAG